MKLYFKYMLMLLRSEMQYRGSFLLMTFCQCLTPFVTFAGVYFMFERFGELKGWSFYEVALCFAVTQVAFSFTECFARGFDVFSSLVVSGNFDRLLVRPRSTVVQVLGSRFEFARIGRLLLSAGVLVWAASQIEASWTPLKVVALVLMVVSGVVIFTGIFILAAAISFWTVQGLEVANIFTDGGREMIQYPLNIYHKWVKRFFTFIIPFACVNYLPLLYILGRDGADHPLYALLPLIGIVFIAPCLLVWRIGVRHYRSTGS
ncbi:ABC-2 type transport system permease protein [Paenibacillus taihuensis]|uniref:ABC-2 type transport system permease protein n=1 Tax=Paenibacillus taihuensis TaxID=1156355 RepID=A0A3D9R1Q3_9BACL|nr:ABC-2 family transporter protein [Paenibacillus taihuensis]REE68683.1 ABC-2 type transport system permease protein [Paenibacillus taihuensis]